MTSQNRLHERKWNKINCFQITCKDTTKNQVLHLIAPCQDFSPAHLHLFYILTSEYRHLIYLDDIIATTCIRYVVCKVMHILVAKYLFWYLITQIYITTIFGEFSLLKNNWFHKYDFTLETYIFVHENDWNKIEDSINVHETLLKSIMVSPNKIKMVSNFNDEISMSDIFWREIMERKILWVPVVSCEKVYERICVGMSMYRFISVSNVMCCMVFSAV